MLVAGATGGVGQLLTAKLLEVHTHRAACSAGIAVAALDRFAFSSQSCPRTALLPSGTPRATAQPQARQQDACHRDLLAGLVCVARAQARPEQQHMCPCSAATACAH